MNTVSDIRDQKARMSGDHEAWIKGKQIAAYEAARKAYLQANPDVGTLIRDGVEIFYRNLTPLHLGQTKEFYPSTVITQ
jgi:hypothetical protein